MATRIGISGWRYPPWRGTFYPEGLAQRRELEFASCAFPTIEVNGTFYALQRPETFKRWYQETPAKFVFSIKAPRYITHIRRLRDVKGPIAKFFASGLLNLREKLGPILWQFPPSMRYDPALFEEFLELLAAHKKRPPRHAVEIRNESFIEPSFMRLLRKHGVALVVAETAGKWPYSEERTADFMYLRLHGDEALYADGYTAKALALWAKRIRAWQSKDVYCYFDNDAKVRSPRDAQSLMKKLRIAWRPAPVEARAR